MKWAFFLLLFVNAAFLIWHQLHRPSGQPAAATAAKSQGNIKSIQLLHEIENSSKGAANSAEPANVTTPRPRETQRSPGNDSSRVDTARTDEPRATAPPGGVEQVPPLSELEKKVLAAEARQAERIEANLAARKNEERAGRERPRPAPESEATACFSLGPFTSPDKADAALAKLSNLALRAVYREQELRSGQQWWVIEATKDERAAQKRLDELNKKKVADASIISNGEYENMISLGRYASEAQANKRVNALVKLGFRPVVEKHFDSTMQYWVDYDETAQHSVTAAQLKEVIGEEQKIEKQKRTCK